MLQRYDICPDQLSAKMLFMANSKLHSITAYGKMVKDLAGVTDDKEVTEENKRQECHNKVLQVMNAFNWLAVNPISNHLLILYLSIVITYFIIPM